MPSPPLPPFPGPQPRALPPDQGPLRGIRVLECGEAYAVPHGTRLLADLGADVIKVESCVRPDVSRVWPFPNNQPGDEFWNRGAIFNEPNRNKRAITLDLRTAAGVEIFKRLVATADVLCENYTPRVMAQFGCDYGSLVAVKPDLIMVSSTGFGHSGPWTNYTAWGFTVEPTAGISHFVGNPDGPPLRTGIAYVDMPAAAIAAYAVLAALRHRRRTGRGQWIDLSQYEVGVGFIGQAVLAASAGRDPGTRSGNRHRAHAPQGVYRCEGSDRWLALTVRSDADFAALCRCIDRPDLVDDERFVTAEARRRHGEALDVIIAAWSAQASAEERAEALLQAGVPAAVAMTNRDLLLDPHLRERGFFELATHLPETGDLGTRPYPGMAVRVSDSYGGIRRAAPVLGQDNDEVLGDLGVEAEKRAELEQEGVIGRQPAAGRMPAAGQRVVEYPQLVESGLVEEYDPDFAIRLGLEREPRSRTRGADDRSR
jgi:crotonobetainyl-CoA:carnitine CoA-transferase CaiB-like acyl-CoA transferase